MKPYKYQRSIFLFSLLLPFFFACSSSEPEIVESSKRPEKVVQVQLETVTAIDLEETFTLPANLEAWEDLTIAAEISGPVRKINYREGDEVVVGDILLEIDPETVQSNLDREQENYNVTQRKLIRYRELSLEGLVSTQDLDDLENSLIVAETGLQAAQLQFEKCFPKAPIAGVVDRLYIERGEFIDKGKPILRLVQVEKLKVIADVPEKDVPFLSVGQKVKVIPAIINNREVVSVPGTIMYISYTANDMTKTYRTKIVIDNSKGVLRPGMIVRAQLVRQQLKQVVTAPLYSVLDRNGEKVVYVVENGYAKQLSVTTGNSIDQRVVIRTGLQPGQQLIIKGQQLLIDGAKVEVGGE